jgi:hypothetical protein
VQFDGRHPDHLDIRGEGHSREREDVWADRLNTVIWRTAQPLAARVTTRTQVRGARLFGWT